MRRTRLLLRGARRAACAQGERAHPPSRAHTLSAGACGGETACSTCHVILTKPFFDKVPEPSEAEEDMLDLALGLTKTSRLGCQVFAAANLDGMEVTLPKEVNNMKKE